MKTQVWRLGDKKPTNVFNMCTLCPHPSAAVAFGALVSEHWLWNMLLMESDFFPLCLQEVHAVGVHGPAANLQGRLQCRVRRVPPAARPHREHHPPLHPAGRPVSEAGTWHQRAPGQTEADYNPPDCTSWDRYLIGHVPSIRWVGVITLVTGCDSGQSHKKLGLC